MSVLYVSDLDGTLLNDDQVVSDESITILTRLIDEGMPFTVATARSWESAGQLLEGLPLQLPVVLINGVFIYDPVKKRNIRSNFLSRSVAREVIQAYEANDLWPVVYTINSQGEPKVYYKGIRNASEDFYISGRLGKGDSRFQLVSRFDDCLLEDIITVNAIDTPERLQAVCDMFRGNGETVCHFGPDIYSPGFHWLEISDKHANKRDGVLFVKHLLGADKLVCFGDNLNDLHMFEAADEKYAVRNAHELILEAATGTILSNAEHGVAKFLDSVYNSTRST